MARKRKQRKVAKKRVATLRGWLAEGDAALALAPQFFGFYAYIGACLAMEDADTLKNVNFVAGASAGALVGGMLAAGVRCAHMKEKVLAFRRKDFWDFPGIGGMLRGRLFQSLIEECLPDGVRTFEQCPLRLGVSAFDVSRLTTRVLTKGDLACALRASCTFPVLFSPVRHPLGLLIDGGVRDTSGLMCIPSSCRRILHVTFASGAATPGVPPSRLPACTAVAVAASPDAPGGGAALLPREVVTLVLEGLPSPHPFAMERGADALEGARELVASLLDAPLARGAEDGHWVARKPAAKLERPGSNTAVPLAQDAAAAAGLIGGRRGGKRLRGGKEEEEGQDASGMAAAAGEIKFDGRKKAKVGAGMAT